MKLREEPISQRVARYTSQPNPTFTPINPYKDLNSDKRNLHQVDLTPYDPNLDQDISNINNRIRSGDWIGGEYLETNPLDDQQISSIQRNVPTSELENNGQLGNLIERVQHIENVKRDLAGKIIEHGVLSEMETPSAKYKVYQFPYVAYKEAGPPHPIADVLLNAVVNYEIANGEHFESAVVGHIERGLLENLLEPISKDLAFLGHQVDRVAQIARPLADGLRNAVRLYDEGVEAKYIAEAIWDGITRKTNMKALIFGWDNDRNGEEPYYTVIVQQAKDGKRGNESESSQYLRFSLEYPLLARELRTFNRIIHNQFEGNIQKFLEGVTPELAEAYREGNTEKINAIANEGKNLKREDVQLIYAYTAEQVRRAIQ